LQLVALAVSPLDAARSCAPLLVEHEGGALFCAHSDMCRKVGDRLSTAVNEGVSECRSPSART